MPPSAGPGARGARHGIPDAKLTCARWALREFSGRLHDRAVVIVTHEPEAAALAAAMLSAAVVIADGLGRGAAACSPAATPLELPYIGHMTL
jgi:hypothetical protein